MNFDNCCELGWWIVIVFLFDVWCRVLVGLGELMIGVC